MEAAQTALNTYEKLVSRRLGYFRVIAARPHSLVIGRHGINNLVLADSATQALHSKRLDTACTHHTHETFAQSETHIARVDRTKLEKVTPEVTVDKLVSLVGRDDSVRYVACHYRYTAIMVRPNSQIKYISILLYATDGWETPQENVVHIRPIKFHFHKRFEIIDNDATLLLTINCVNEKDYNKTTTSKHKFLTNHVLD